MAYDTTPRYAPDRILAGSAKNGFRVYPVKQYISHPSGKHPEKCPIGDSYTALELVTDGGSRWYGFENAYINSELRMVVVGFDDRDEVRAKWEVAKYP